VAFRVLLILDPSYGDKLRSLSADFPVWIVNSPENDRVVNELRANSAYKSVQVTTFPLKEGECRSRACERIIESLDQHYNEYAEDGAYLELEVIGVALDEVSVLPFSAVGFTRFCQTNAGFIAYKARD
jgi:hypothetical protein